MAGQVNSWLSQFADTENPCIGNPTGLQSFSSCILWLVAGVILGGLTFSKKKQVTK